MTAALDGLRVVDLSHYLAGPATAMILGDLGADVVRIDPPGGPRWHHPANAMLQRGKRSIVLDLHDGADRTVAQQLVASADVVVESFRPGVAAGFGVGPAESLAANPRLVYCSIPGFGADDPRAALPGWEGVVMAALGFFVSRTPAPDDDDLVFNAVPIASSFATMQACHAIAAALIARERTGRGQSIEVALFDAGFEALGHTGMRRPDGAGLPHPASMGAMHQTMPHVGYYQCADGRWVHLCLLQDRHREWFIAAYRDRIGDVLDDTEKIFGDPEAQAVGRARLAELFATRPALEWERTINEEVGAPTTICNTTEEWLRDDEHARDSGAVVELVDPELGPTMQAGFPIMMGTTPLEVHGARHGLDDDRASILAELADATVPTAPDLPPDGPPDGVDPETLVDGALTGIKVVDITQVLAGPTATRILSEYGADVVKVNSFDDRQAGLHQYTNSGKQHVLLNLKTTQGMEILRELIGTADVFHENFTRGVAERMGIGEGDVRAIRPDIIYSSIPAFGHAGYRGGYRGREELGQSCTGLERRWGGAGEPRMIGYAMNDYGAGNWSAFAIMMALYHRIRTGDGQRVHTSLAHAGTFHQLPFMVAYDGATWSEPSGQDALGWNAFDRLYRASDRWLFVAAPTPADRERLATVEGLGAAVVAPDDAARQERMEAALATRPADEWVRRFAAAGVGAHVVPSFEELMEDDVTKARGLSVTREHPGVGPVRLVGPAPRLAGTPTRLTRPAGEPGSETAEVLVAVGRGEQLDELVGLGVVLEQLPEGAAMVGRFR